MGRKECGYFGSDTADWCMQHVEDQLCVGVDRDVSSLSEKGGIEE